MFNNWKRSIDDLSKGTIRKLIIMYRDDNVKKTILKELHNKFRSINCVDINDLLEKNINVLRSDVLILDNFELIFLSSELRDNVVNLLKQVDEDVRIIILLSLPVIHVDLESYGELISLLKDFERIIIESHEVSSEVILKGKGVFNFLKISDRKLSTLSKRYGNLISVILNDDNYVI
ncbi:MAG: hypothetical protein B6V02_01815 [Thermoprotei archaeon ex4572_64]|nr:MAG: hypothetical protein B6V02_01815 [Thermoprotei archaeon ex4572_64]